MIESLRGLRIGCAMTGSFCTFRKVFEVWRALKAAGAELIPIMSFNACSVDTRFYPACEAVGTFEEIAGRKVIASLNQAEPIGPKKLLDLLILAPCTGNTLGKLACGIYDTAPTLAVKSHRRNGRPVLIAVSTNDALAGAAAGIELTLSLAGPICLWSALARAMEQTGLTVRLCRALRPGLRRLFPACAADEEGFSSLCGNLAANLLGLGNAATPLGVRAAQRMQALSGAVGASDEMCLLVVMNTASLQLIPSTVAAVRARLGAAHAFDILPAVWLASACSVAAGILAARGLKRCWKT